MVFSSEENIFIKNLVLLKGFSSRRMIKEFPQKGWNKNGLDVLLQKIRKRPPWIVSQAAYDHIRCTHQRTLMQ